VIEGAFTLEVEDRVDDVLEGLGAGDAAPFGDVADEQDRGPRFLGEPHQPCSALADLPHVAGGALELFGIGGLDRVEEHHAGAERRGVMHDRLEARLAEHVDAAGILA